MSFLQWYFGCKTFCCCLPVRWGVLVMTVVSVVMTAILSVILWYEITNNHDLSTYAKSAFIVAGSVQTVYAFASVFGFVGALLRKKRFVVIYAYFIYTHLVINFATTVWFIWLVAHEDKTDIIQECKARAADEQAKARCASLLNLTQGVFITFAGLILLVESYCAVMLNRYVARLKSQIRVSKSQSYRSTPSQDYGSSSEVNLKPFSLPAYDPYQSYPERNYSPIQAIGPHPDPHPGYGGGSWTYKDIADEEKRRLRDLQSRNSSFVASTDIPTVHNESINKVPKQEIAMHAVRGSAASEALPLYNLDRSGHNLLVDR